MLVNQNELNSRKALLESFHAAVPSSSRKQVFEGMFRDECVLPVLDLHPLQQLHCCPSLMCGAINSSTV